MEMVFYGGWEGGRTGSDFVSGFTMCADDGTDAGFVALSGELRRVQYTVRTIAVEWYVWIDCLFTREAKKKKLAPLSEKYEDNPMRSRMVIGHVHNAQPGSPLSYREDFLSPIPFFWLNNGGF